MESEIVCLDFDGVIADTFRLSYTMHKILDPSLTEENYRRGFNDNQNHISTKLGRAPEQAARFWRTYQLKVVEQPAVPEMIDIILHLSDIYTLYIISSSNSSSIRAFLRHYRVEDCFHNILGQDTHPSKTRKLLQVIAQHHAEPTDLVMVTDTLGDIKQARAAGVSSIAVTWGYHPESILKLGHPVSLLEKPDQLPSALEEFFDFSREYDTH